MQQAACAEFWFIFVLPERKPDGRKQHPIFLGLFYKSAKICFYFEHAQIKENLLQFRLLWLKGVVASTLRRKKKIKWSLQRCMHTQLSILPWKCCLFIYHYKKQSVKHMEKKTHCSVEICSKICAVKHYHRTAVKLCKTFSFTWILERQWSRPT